MRPIPAPARVIRTALSLRAAGFVRPPREGRILAGSQRVPCPPRHPARRPPPGFARPPRERRILEVSQRVPARRVALRAAGSARRRFLPAASPARASASTVQSYPCLPPVLCAASPCARRFFPAPRGKGGYWQGASACRARRVALRARPRPPRGLTLRAAGSARLQFLPALRGKGGYWQGASACPVRRPPRRPAPARPRPLRARRIHCAVLSLPAAGFFLRSAARVPRVAYPCARPRPPCGLSLRAAGSARLQFCLRSAGRADIGSEPARAVPAASPCAPARVIRTALSLRAAGFVRRVALRAPVIACVPREGRILELSQRVPARRVALRARPHPLCSPIPACRRFFPSLRRPPPPARPIPACRRFFPALRGKDGYWQGASAYRARRVTLRARPRPPRGLTQRAAGSVRRVALRARPHPLCSPIPACRQFFPALRRPRSPCGLSLRAAGSARRVALRAPVIACVPREGRILAGIQRPPPASSAQSYPSVPRVLSVRRGKGGYWK